MKTITRRDISRCLAFAAAMLAAPSSPRADDALPAGGAAPEEPKVKATAFALPHPDVDEPTMVDVMKAVEAGMKKNQRLEMKELDTRLADYAQETPTAEIESARSTLKEGQQALTELRIPEAVQKLERAVAVLATVLPYIKKQELADAQAALAVAKFQNNDKKGGHEAFVELLTWRPDYVYDPSKLPPEFTSQFDEAQRQVEKAKKATVAIQSDPPGAQAFIDGKSIGFTPCTADGQPVGKHYVTLKREGYKKAVAPVIVTKKGDAQATIALERSEKYLLVEQARAKVEATLGQDLLDPDAENLKVVLYVEHAVFVKAAAEGNTKVSVDAWLYDLRNRRKLSHVHTSVTRDAIGKQLASVATNLYTNVSYDSDLAAPVDAPPPSNVKPLYKTWGLWAGIGAGVVLVGGGVLTYYGIKAASDPSCPTDTANCYSFQP